MYVCFILNNTEQFAQLEPEKTFWSGTAMNLLWLLESRNYSPSTSKVYYNLIHTNFNYFEFKSWELGNFQLIFDLEVEVCGICKSFIYLLLCVK